MIERFMDDETIRLFCFFVTNKYNPSSEVCKHCARSLTCARDMQKSFARGKNVSQAEKELLEELLEKQFGIRKCKSCEL